MAEGLHVLLDQNVPREVTDGLRARRPSWRVSHVVEMGLKGRRDPEIFAWAQSETAIVVTYDEDFADARTYALGRHCGVVRLRVWPTTVEETQAALERLLNSVSDEEWSGSLIIVGPRRIRIRKAAL